jgi:hypothetical protein
MKRQEGVGIEAREARVAIEPEDETWTEII